MFDITTSRDFLAKLEADHDDFVKEPHSALLALNCAVTAYHLHEWVWGDWLKRNDEAQKAIGLDGTTNKERKAAFIRWIDRACPWFGTIQDLANGTKHFGSAETFTTERVSSPPFIWGELNAGWGEGSWDGPKPYVADNGKGHLLIDYGEGTGPHRWKTAAELLRGVVLFWRQFFEQYHPDPEARAEVREWRLQL